MGRSEKGGGVRRWFTLLVLFGFPGTFWAQEISQKIVGPGVVHFEYRYPDIPQVLDVLQVDLTNPFVRIETIKAGDKIVGREKTSLLARRTDREGHRVIAAINGDFFAEDGTPVNTQVINGQLLKDPARYSTFGIFQNGKPFIQTVSFKGVVCSASGKSRSIQGINRGRNTDELILYNRYFDEQTGTNIWGAEIQFRTITNWVVNDTVQVVVVAIDSTQGSQAIPMNGGILSGHGKSCTWLLRNVALGDTLKLVLSLPPVTGPIAELIGGIPRIIRDGRISIEEGYEGSNFALTRHPRTAVGFTQDSTTLFLVTVDGRQPEYSVGMSLKELASFMLSLGAYQGINLDGGGSTTLIVRGKIENRPSDATGERPVSNALLVISTAQMDTVGHLEIQKDSVQLFWGHANHFYPGQFKESRTVSEDFVEENDLPATPMPFSKEDGLVEELPDRRSKGLKGPGIFDPGKY